MSLAVAPVMAEQAWSRLGIVPSFAVRVFGMRRSGNHAIIDWLLRNAPGPGTVFLNNCGFSRDPFRTCKSVAVNGRRVPREGRFANTTRSAGDGAMVLLSYEDAVPAAATGAKPASKGVPDTAFDAQVLIYRGFCNWAASLLRKLQGHPDYTALARMRIMLKSVETYRDALARLSHGGLVGISYDRWQSSDAYRSDRLATLGLPQRDNSLGPVQSYGRGSSFQPDAASADDLNTAHRAAEMADDPEFQLVMALAARDPMLIDLVGTEFASDAAYLADLSRNPLIPGRPD